MAKFKHTHFNAYTICTTQIVLWLLWCMMPHLSLLEKRKQHFQLGQYLNANGLQSKPLRAFPEQIHSTHTDKKRSFDHNTSVCFDVTVYLYNLLLRDMFLCQVPLLLLAVWLNMSHVKTWLNLLMFLMMMTCCGASEEHRDILETDTARWYWACAQSECTTWLWCDYRFTWYLQQPGYTTQALWYYFYHQSPPTSDSTTVHQPLEICWACEIWNATWGNWWIAQSRAGSYAWGPFTSSLLSSSFRQQFFYFTKALWKSEGHRTHA